MDKILIALLIISVILGIYGIVILFYPSSYQKNGRTCEKNTINTCPTITNDYYIFGSVMIITGLLITGLVLFELFR